MFISALIAYRREFRRRLRSRGREVVVGRGVHRAKARRAASAVARVYTPRVCGRTPAVGCMNGRPCPVPPPLPPHPYTQRVYTHTRSLARPPARPLTRTTRCRRLPTCSRCGAVYTVDDGRNAREKRVNPFQPPPSPKGQPRDRQRSSTRVRR